MKIFKNILNCTHKWFFFEDLKKMIFIMIVNF